MLQRKIFSDYSVLHLAMHAILLDKGPQASHLLFPPLDSIRNSLYRCRIFFTVTNNGSIDEVKMVETSNYSDVDEAFIKIVKDIPRKWTPAQNGKGKKVGQEFVFTFGVAGC
jgi:hypothetical protein